MNKVAAEFLVIIVMSLLLMATICMLPGVSQSLIVLTWSLVYLSSKSSIVNFLCKDSEIVKQYKRASFLAVREKQDITLKYEKEMAEKLRLSHEVSKLTDSHKKTLRKCSLLEKQVETTKSQVAKITATNVEISLEKNTLLADLKKLRKAEKSLIERVRLSQAAASKAEARSKVLSREVDLLQNSNDMLADYKVKSENETKILKSKLKKARSKIKDITSSDKKEEEEKKEKAVMEESDLLLSSKEPDYKSEMFNLNQQLQITLEQCAYHQSIHNKQDPLKTLKCNIKQLVDKFDEHKKAFRNLKDSQENRKVGLANLAHSAISLKCTTRQSTLGCLWEINYDEFKELRLLLSSDTVLVGSFIVYLLCQRYHIPTSGFDEADIDLITRLQPAVWQKKYESLGIQVVKLWTRNHVVALKATLGNRTLDVIFVNVAPELDLYMWLNQDVYSRPDNSISVFYGVSNNSQLMAYDPSGEGLLSFLTGYIRMIGHSNETIANATLNDPIRILRIANASAKFDLKVEPRTKEIIKRLNTSEEMSAKLTQSWLLSKHRKYACSNTGKQYSQIILELGCSGDFSSFWAKKSLATEENVEREDCTVVLEK